jgi:segregation and condensation protein A
VVPDLHSEQPPPPVALSELLHALREVMRRADLFVKHRIEKESLSLRERMASVLAKVVAEQFTAFPELFDISEGRMGVVVTFMAVLELIKNGLIELVQAEAFALIHVKARVSAT